MSLTPTAQAWSHSLSTVHHRRDNIFTKILRALRRLRGRPDAPPTSRRSSISHYDPNNIFARILRGEIPCHKVYEDENALVSLDIRPRAPGHTVVLTKAPMRTILDCEPEHLVQVMQIAQHIARAAMQVFAVDGITIQQFNESAGAQTVPHLPCPCHPAHHRRSARAAEWQDGEGRSSGRPGSEARCRDQTCGVQGNPPLFARCFAGLRKTN